MLPDLAPIGPVSRPILRFAPSPNGYLHLGHAYSALLNARLARRLGGVVLLRIEDIDIGRCRPAYAEALLEDLAWLGLAYPQPVRRQSDHFATYAAVLDELRRRGLLYPCFCSRAEIAAAVGRRGETPRDPDGALLYPGTCRALAPAEVERRLAAGTLHTLRLRMDEACALCSEGLTMRVCDCDCREGSVAVDPRCWGDVVLGRRDVPTSYHLAVTVDDALQGVTHVVRGADLLAATAIHRLLQRLLGLAEPCYHHHRLITDDDGRKLAKSVESLPLRQLRARGITAGDVRRDLGFGDLEAGA
ncbi:tRNA glutamyl-Q(34) synthetase GluQRS [Chelatococcus reniformis]|uniref:tRNA glutamyl-Q(34) synthetase GluQRS n=1 Tax=Chelatococcus reniformis TaxID=1494448 RepID=A0A916TXJ2_9HYPH|nr:tRNA glutamyl-Q(34) synthetase GluQRS [Chelatococcus reniformis]GGC44968.1 tRNA glutamyl-Q(34) synthetase GluQRS [Chelatococcus reniformis]